MAISLLVASPVFAVAQAGLFDRGLSDEDYYGFGGMEKTTGVFGNRGVQTTGVIDNQIFGQDVPIGSGVLVLLAAGAGYMALKRKEDEQ